MVRKQLELGVQQFVKHVTAHAHQALGSDFGNSDFGDVARQAANGKNANDGGRHHPNINAAFLKAAVQQKFQCGWNQWLGSSGQGGGKKDDEPSTLGAAKIRHQSGKALLQCQGCQRLIGCGQAQTSQHTHAQRIKSSAHMVRK